MTRRRTPPHDTIDSCSDIEHVETPPRLPSDFHLPNPERRVGRIARGSSEEPCIRLSGAWLRAAGFRPDALLLLMVDTWQRIEIVMLDD